MLPNKLDQIADRQRAKQTQHTAFAAFMIALVALMVISLGAVRTRAVPTPAPAPFQSLAEQIAADTAEMCGDDAVLVHAPDDAPVC